MARRSLWTQSAPDSDPSTDRGDAVPDRQPGNILLGLHAKPGIGSHRRETRDHWRRSGTIAADRSVPVYDVLDRRIRHVHRGQYSDRGPIGVVERRPAELV